MRTEQEVESTITNNEGGDLHIVDGVKYPPEAMVWRALCGDSCFAVDDDEGTLEPPDFDFYLLSHGHEKATCIRCRKIAGFE